MILPSVCKIPAVEYSELSGESAREPIQIDKKNPAATPSLVGHDIGPLLAVPSTVPAGSHEPGRSTSQAKSNQAVSPYQLKDMRK